MTVCWGCGPDDSESSRAGDLATRSAKAIPAGVKDCGRVSKKRRRLAQREGSPIRQRRLRPHEEMSATQDPRHGDQLPEPGSETTSLSQLCTANGIHLTGSQHSCPATGDGRGHAAEEVVWEHGDLIGYRVSCGEPEVLTPWVPTWELASEFPPEAVARVMNKRQGERITAATTTTDKRKRKARGRPRRPLTGNAAPPSKAPPSFDRRTVLTDHRRNLQGRGRQQVLM